MLEIAMFCQKRRPAVCAARPPVMCQDTLFKFFFCWSYALCLHVIRDVVYNGAVTCRGHDSVTCRGHDSRDLLYNDAACAARPPVMCTTRFIFYFPPQSCAFCCVRDTGPNVQR